MRSLLVSTYEDMGGASLAAKRLYQGLKNIGLDSRMYVQVKTSDDPDVITSESRLYRSTTMVRDYADSAPLALYRNRIRTSWSVGILPYNINKMIRKIQPDIVNVHWINGGFFPVSQLKKIKGPLVITLHDMWYFTGGCHYTGDCEKYKIRCGNCPQLNSNHEYDLSYFLFKRKEKHLNQTDADVVSPSRWLADCAKKSMILKDKNIHVIPNGIDLTVYKPVDQSVARKILNLPLGKKFILFGAVGAASIPRKGFRHLQSALQLLPADLKSECELLTFGDTVAPEIPDTGIPLKNLGRVSGEIALSLVYSAADIYISPALQEAFGLTVLESMACGTPVVAFDTGGARDMIDHKISGYLAEMENDADLSRGIEWILENNSGKGAISEKARDKISRSFDINLIASQYRDLYHRLLEAAKG